MHRRSSRSPRTCSPGGSRRHRGARAGDHSPAGGRETGGRAGLRRAARVVGAGTARSGCRPAHSRPDCGGRASLPGGAEALPGERLVSARPGGEPPRPGTHGRSRGGGGALPQGVGDRRCPAYRLALLIRTGRCHSACAGEWAPPPPGHGRIRFRPHSASPRRGPCALRPRSRGRAGGARCRRVWA